ncbi:hypothetical protein DIE11_29750 [Burkholderia sp. Bp9012]|nr:hypothetical protein DIE11_29750 [Burkholderia sp. Bp9012]RQZ61516.1 hypothetical protein DIE08_28620 [Burkholderia sp. Bp9004]
MPGAAQCGSPPRRRFRDTEPIIKQHDADRQPSVPHVRHAPWPESRFGSGVRIVAILPACARVGLLTDCKGSSD